MKSFFLLTSFLSIKILHSTPLAQNDNNNNNLNYNYDPDNDYYREYNILDSDLNVKEASFALDDQEEYYDYEYENEIDEDSQELPDDNNNNDDDDDDAEYVDYYPDSNNQSNQKFESEDKMSTIDQQNVEPGMPYMVNDEQPDNDSFSKNSAENDNIKSVVVENSSVDDDEDENENNEMVPAIKEENINENDDSAIEPIVPIAHNPEKSNKVPIIVDANGNLNEENVMVPVYKKKDEPSKPKIQPKPKTQPASSARVNSEGCHEFAGQTDSQGVAIMDCSGNLSTAGFLAKPQTWIILILLIIILYLIHKCCCVVKSNPENNDHDDPIEIEIKESKPENQIISISNNNSTNITSISQNQLTTIVQNNNNNEEKQGLLANDSNNNRQIEISQIPLGREVEQVTVTERNTQSITVVESTTTKTVIESEQKIDGLLPLKPALPGLNESELDKEMNQKHDQNEKLRNSSGSTTEGFRSSHSQADDDNENLIEEDDLNGNPYKPKNSNSTNNNNDNDNGFEATVHISQISQEIISKPISSDSGNVDLTQDTNKVEKILSSVSENHQNENNESPSQNNDNDDESGKASETAATKDKRHATQEIKFPTVQTKYPYRSQALGQGLNDNDGDEQLNKS